MELIYFISGILTVGVGYGVWLLSKVRSSHADLLRSNQHSTNISSARYGEMKEKIEDMNVYVSDIQGKLETDTYANILKLNKRVGKLDTEITKHKKRLDVDIGTSETSFGRVFSEIQQLKNTIKTLKEDPNFLNRY